jgi:hypothetical protein
LDSGDEISDEEMGSAAEGERTNEDADEAEEQQDSESEYEDPDAESV